MVSKAYVKRWNLNEVTTPARKSGNKKEQAASRASVGQKKEERVRFGSSEERRPRDASPVSVAFGGDRGQFFCVIAARTTISASSAAAAAFAAAAFVVWVPLVASPKKHENGFVRTRKLMQPCRLGKILVAINWLD